MVNEEVIWKIKQAKKWMDVCESELEILNKKCDLCGQISEKLHLDYFEENIFDTTSIKPENWLLLCDKCRLNKRKREICLGKYKQDARQELSTELKKARKVKLKDIEDYTILKDLFEQEKRSLSFLLYLKNGGSVHLCSSKDRARILKNYNVSQKK